MKRICALILLSLLSINCALAGPAGVTGYDMATGLPESDSAKAKPISPPPVTSNVVVAPPAVDANKSAVTKAPVGYDMATGLAESQSSKAKLISTPPVTSNAVVAPSSSPTVRTNKSGAARSSVGYNLVTGKPENSAAASKPAASNLQPPPVISPSKTATSSVLSSFSKNPLIEVGDGFAVGAQFGVASGIANLELPASDNQTRAVSIGSIGGLNLSYGYSFVNQFYLGAEVYANLENMQRTKFGTDSTIFKIGNNYGVVLLPGYHLAPSNLLYLKLGINYANLSFYTISQGANPTWKYGSDVGFGFKQSLNEHLSLGLEYDWIRYNKFSYQNVFDRAGAASANLSQNFYLLNLSYQFGKVSPAQPNFRKALQLSGFYMGLNAGFLNQELDDNFTVAGNSGSDHFQANGYFEGVKLGYGRQFKSWFYLGSELFAQMAENVEPQQYSASFNKQKESYGLSLLPGYLFNPTNLLFTRIGYVRTHFNGSNQSTVGNGTAYDQSVNGFQLGLGYETALATHISMTIEYDYNKYSKFTVGPSPFGVTDQYSITDNLMSLGLNYRF